MQLMILSPIGKDSEDQELNSILLSFCIQADGGIGIHDRR